MPEDPRPQGTRHTPVTPVPPPRVVLDPPTSELVTAAARGDRPAWDALVARYAGLVWAVARAHRLGPADAADVSQTTWLRLVEHLDRLRDPEKVGAWLAATARHECLRTLRKSSREVPDDGTGLEEQPTGEDSPESHVLRLERQRHVHRAMARLSQRCQLLLRALSCSPDASYADISEALGMPMGSIGPTRGRCLDRLRRALMDDDAGALPAGG